MEVSQVMDPTGDGDPHRFCSDASEAGAVGGRFAAHAEQQPVTGMEGSKIIDCIYGCLWICVEFYRFLWICVEFYRFLWIWDGFLWIWGGFWIIWSTKPGWHCGLSIIVHWLLGWTTMEKMSENDAEKCATRMLVGCHVLHHFMVGRANPRLQAGLQTLWKLEL